MALLGLYVEKDGVVAVGEIGYDDVTPAEVRRALRAMAARETRRG